MMVKSDEDVDGYGDRDGDIDGDIDVDIDVDVDVDVDGNDYKIYLPNKLYNFPSPFPPNFSSVFRLPVSYLISPDTIIVFNKVVISSIPPNLPYYITTILIVSFDKDISPNTIIAPDKDSSLILIIVLDRATLQPLL